jgi:hypothetical protein
VNRGHVGFIRVCFPVEFGCYDARCHSRNGYLLGGADCVHFGIGEFDLPRVHVLDQFVMVHEVDADDVVVQFIYDIYRMSEFLSFDPEVHLIDPN